jgi:hypothetical protein
LGVRCSDAPEVEWKRIDIPFQQSDHCGLPGKVQLEVIYGHLAEAMLPQAATSI